MLSHSARAQDGDGLAWVDRLNAITVTATRSPKHLLEVPATVSVIGAAEIEDDLHEDIKDLVRFEPGVSVTNSPSRFTAAGSSTGRDGNAGFTIRGLGGNRVVIETDGIRLPDAYSLGPQSVGRGDYADLDLIKSVEILRGPASALYGSDGLAGAVSFATKDPDDLLKLGQSVGGRARIGWSGADNGWAESAMIAARQGDVSTLLAYTRRDSQEQKNQGTNYSRNTDRTAPNPQTSDANAVLAKLLWTPGVGHRIRFTIDHQDRNTATDALTAIAKPPATGPLAGTATLGLQAFDELRRDRFSIDHHYEGDGTIRRASWTIYHQTSRTRQYAAEDRNTSADRTRDNRFDNRVTGANASIEAALGGPGFSNTVLLGGDWSRTHQVGTRDGTVASAGDSFPSRGFPITDYTLAGLFLQDEISFGEGRLVLYPAIRFDHYSLDPKADPLYTGLLASQSKDHVSPKFGAVAWATPTVGLFANYASGFRAPTPSQVNNGFSNPTQFYSSIPNPSLKPETSQTIEGGIRLRDLRLRGARLSASLTGFAGWYKDFIDQVEITGTASPTPTNPWIFQYVNLGRVRISGVEGKLDADLGDGFGANLAAGYTEGRTTSIAGDRTPLSSIDPFKLVGGVRYRDQQRRFGGQIIGTWSVAKKQSDISNTEGCSPNCYTPGGFVLLDATAFIKLTDAAALRAGIFNIFDRKYIWWSDVRGVANTSAILDSYTQPGRNVSASLTLSF